MFIQLNFKLVFVVSIKNLKDGVKLMEEYSEDTLKLIYYDKKAMKKA